MITARIVRVIALVVLGNASVRAAGAQQIAYAASVGPELDSATQAALTREFARARDHGVPVEPLAAKVREGRLKRAPSGLIHSAVTRLVDRLATARAALGAESTTEELTAGADALANGADEASLRAVRGATPRAIAAPLGTLAQLLASGVPAKKATEMIVTLLRKNATPAQLLALGNMVETDVATGLRPNESAAIRMRGIEGSLGFGGGDTIVSGTTAATDQPKNTPPPGSLTNAKGQPVRRP